MNIWHLTFASDGRRPLVGDEAGRRAVVRTLARPAGRDIALFCLVDDHVHIVARAARTEVGSLARSVVLGLRAGTSGRVDPARVRDVETRSHLEWLVRYVLTQVTHHGLDAHPALWSGSCFQDLAGARVVDGLRLCTSQALPRLRLRALHTIVGLEQSPLEPASDEAIRGAGVARLLRAATAATCTQPELDGTDKTNVSARNAIVQLGVEAGMAVADLAWALNTTQRSVRRYLERPAPPGWIEAVRVRHTLETRVSARP